MLTVDTNYEKIRVGKEFRMKGIESMRKDNKCKVWKRQYYLLMVSILITNQSMVHTNVVQAKVSESKMESYEDEYWSCASTNNEDGEGEYYWYEGMTLEEFLQINFRVNSEGEEAIPDDTTKEKIKEIYGDEYRDGTELAENVRSANLMEKDWQTEYGAKKRKSKSDMEFIDYKLTNQEDIYAKQPRGSVAPNVLESVEIPLDYKNTSFIYGSVANYRRYLDYYSIGGMLKSSDEYSNPVVDFSKIYTIDDIMNMSASYANDYSGLIEGITQQFTPNKNMVYDMDYEKKWKKKTQKEIWEMLKLFQSYGIASGLKEGVEMAHAVTSAVFGEKLPIYNFYVDKNKDLIADGYEKVGLDKEALHVLPINVNKRFKNEKEFHEAVEEKVDEIKKEDGVIYVKSLSVKESKKWIVKVYKTCAGGSDNVYVKPLKKGTTVLTIKAKLSDGRTVSYKTKVTITDKTGTIKYTTQENPACTYGALIAEHGEEVKIKTNYEDGYRYEMIDGKRMRTGDLTILKPSNSKNIPYSIGYYSGAYELLDNGGSEQEAYDLMIDFIYSYAETLLDQKTIDKYSKSDSYILKFIADEDEEVPSEIVKEIAKILGIKNFAKLDGTYDKYGLKSKIKGVKDEYFIYLDGQYRMLEQDSFELDTKRNGNPTIKKVKSSLGDKVTALDIVTGDLKYTVKSENGGYLYISNTGGSIVSIVDTVKVEPGTHTFKATELFGEVWAGGTGIRNGFVDISHYTVWFVDNTENPMSGMHNKELEIEDVSKTQAQMVYLEKCDFNYVAKGDKLQLNLINSDISDWEIVDKCDVAKVTKGGLVTYTKKVDSEEVDLSDNSEIILRYKKNKKIQLIFSDNWENGTLMNNSSYALKELSTYNRSLGTQKELDAWILVTPTQTKLVTDLAKKSKPSIRKQIEIPNCIRNLNNLPSTDRDLPENEQSIW